MNSKVIGLGLGLSLGVAGTVLTTDVADAYTQVRETLYTTASSLNLRKGPSTKYGVITSMPAGSKVTKVSFKNGWAKIEYARSGRTYTGFASANYLTKKVPAVVANAQTTKATHKVTGEGLRVRRGAGTAFSTISKLSKGTNVEVISTRNTKSNGIEWSQIRYGGVKGYVAANYLEKINSKPQTSTQSKPVVKPSTEQPKKDAYEGYFKDSMTGLIHEHSNNCATKPSHLGNLNNVEVILTEDVMLYADPCNEVSKIDTIDSGTSIIVYIDNEIIDKKHGSRVLISTDMNIRGVNKHVSGYIYTSSLPANTGNAHIDFLRTL